MGERPQQHGREVSGKDPAPAPETDQVRPATPEDFEDDPARNPEDKTLKDLKGG